MKVIKFILVLVLLNFSLMAVTPAFRENKNQWPSHVLFAAEFAGGQVFIERTGLTWQLLNLKDLQRIHDQKQAEIKSDSSVVHGHNFKVEFLNAKLEKGLTGNKQPEYYNYFLGNDASSWASGVNAYEIIYFKNSYKNIDIKFYHGAGNFKYDFVVKPGGKVNDIQLKYDHINGVSLKDNKVVIKTSVGDIIESIPEAYQLINGKKIILDCSYVLYDNVISFQVDKKYDPRYDLVIDPSVVVSSYSGTESVTYGLGASPDENGNIYLYGISITKNYPTTFGAVQSVFYGGFSDCTLSKFNTNGTAKIFSTYIGGNKDEVIINCVIQKGEIAVFGYTSSDTFPIIKNGFQPKHAGEKDYFIIKFDTSGKVLLSSTYLGGKRTECLSNINNNTNYIGTAPGELIMDNDNNCYVLGNSTSFNYPTTAGSFQQFCDSTNYGDMVVTKLNSNLTQLFWSTYYGGTFGEMPAGLRLSQSGVLYCAGATTGPDFYTTNGVISTTKIVTPDLVAFSLNSTTGLPIASTYLGSKGSDIGYRLALDLNDNLYIAATTSGPVTVTSTPGAFNVNSGNVIFYKVNKDLTQILTLAKLGYPSVQTKLIEIDALHVDSCGYIYFAGFGLPGLPVTPNAFKTVGAAKGNMYMGVFNPNFTSLKFASYFGGGAVRLYDHDDGGVNYFDGRGHLYHGLCIDQDFPVTANAYSTHNVKDSISYTGGWYKNSDAFVKIDLHTFVNAGSTLGGEIKSCVPVTATFVATTNLGTVTIIPGDGSPSVNTGSLVHVYNTYGVYHAYVIAGTDTSTCNQTDSIKLVIKYGPQPSDNLADTTHNCFGITDALNAGNNGALFAWNTGYTGQTISPYQTGMYYVNIDNGYCSIKDSSYLKMFSGEYPMILPNIITPNNDAVNDYWDFSKYAIDDLDFTVFNRWGTPVYHTNNGADKWNGVNQNGRDLSDGTYFWIINFKSNCKPLERTVQKGFIQIAR